MNRTIAIACAAAAVSLCPASASASEIFGGLYVHDVDTIFTLSGVEGGMDVQLGWRGNSVGRVIGAEFQPYVFGAINTAGETNYAAAGISAKFGDSFYVRPGLGLAIHDGSAANFEDPDNGKVDFGSRILFEPELAIGTRINDRTTIEASWVHMSQAQLFGKQNPGIDNFGVRLNIALH